MDFGARTFLIVLGLLCGFLPAYSSKAQPRVGDNASCEEINAEINRVYEMTEQRGGAAEVISFLLFPHAAVEMHDRRRKAESSAEQVLYSLLELAQLRSCEVSVKQPRAPMRPQLVRISVGTRELECVKPNGVRVYTTYRDIPEIRTRRAEVYSFPPKGPSIVLDKATSEFNEVVQEFIYERACEAHRQNVRLNSQQGTNYSRQLKYNCGAIRRLKSKDVLGAEQFDVLLDHMKAHEFAANTYYTLESQERIRMDDALIRCFASEDFKP